MVNNYGDEAATEAATMSKALLCTDTALTLERPEVVMAHYVGVFASVEAGGWSAAEFVYLFLALAVIGAVCDLIKTGIDIGSAAGWWP